MKINDFWGELTDISAKKEPLLTLQVMTSCWHANPEQRPTFEELRLRLAAVAEIVRRNQAPEDCRSFVSRSFGSTPLTQSLKGSRCSPGARSLESFIVGAVSNIPGAPHIRCTHNFLKATASAYRLVYESFSL